MDHDAAYKLLFACLRMVRSFLCAFLPELAAQLNLDTLELVSPAFLSDEGLRRTSDIVWRAKLRDNPETTVLLVFEFQSTVSWRMVERMEVYKALCLDAAAKQPWGQPRTRLRLVPIVVHNGSSPWTAPVEAPPRWPADGSGEIRPGYLLVDLAVQRAQDLEGAGAAGMLVRLEHAGTPEEFADATATLAGMLADPEDAALRDAFSTWIVALMKARKLDAHLLETTQLLAGGKPMIAETMDRWTQEWFQDGRAKGRTEGRREGRDEGLKEGLVQQKALLRQRVDHKFGPEAAAQLDSLLDRVAGPAQMLDMALATAGCETAEDFLARAKKGLD